MNQGFILLRRDLNLRQSVVDGKSDAFDYSVTQISLNISKLLKGCQIEPL